MENLPSSPNRFENLNNVKLFWIDIYQKYEKKILAQFHSLMSQVKPLLKQSKEFILRIN